MMIKATLLAQKMSKFKTDITKWERQLLKSSNLSITRDQAQMQPQHKNKITRRIGTRKVI